MNKLKQLKDWFTKSSADPTKISLTIRAGIPFLLAISVWTGAGIDEKELLTVADALVAVVVGGGTVISGATAIVGFGRKLWNTYRNK